MCSGAASPHGQPWVRDPSDHSVHSLHPQLCQIQAPHSARQAGAVRMRSFQYRLGTDQPRGGTARRRQLPGPGGLQNGVLAERTAARRASSGTRS